ncbi:MAG: Cof-type HAD-IIB family hydrolase [Bacillota bacterium]|nr:Cof-type HAD-IIB family hydrolase [Bacillota bacterium]
MTVKLVALDLDDTLLDSGLKISPECVRVIREARKKGVWITFSTGRMYASALPYANQLEIDVPLITYQGAWVKHSASGEVLYYKPVPDNLAAKVMNYFENTGVHYHSYFEDELCMEVLSEEGRFYAGIAGVKPRIVRDLVKELDTSDALKIMAVTDNDKMILRMETDLKERYGDVLHITRSKPFFLEVMSKEADKGKALQVVAEHYGVERKEVMAVGDSFNDIAMIEWAGLGIAMGNAFDVVKDAADFVTTGNDEEGVAEAIKRFVL